jgi:soluble lytic murein transglycosylase-like protein
MLRRLGFVAIVAAVCCPAAEIALLANGLQLRIDRHEQQGGEYLLYAASGVTRIPAVNVVGFETIPEPARPAAPPAHAPPPSPSVATSAANTPAKTPEQLLEEAALKHGIPVSFVKLVARAESAFNPKAVSPKGAIGLMQLMPATAQSLGADPWDPAQNAEAGARHLKELLEKYEDYPDQLRRALAAYNAGPGAVQKYNGVPPYRETQGYVHKIVEQYKRTLR